MLSAFKFLGVLVVTSLLGTACDSPAKGGPQSQPVEDNHESPGASTSESADANDRYVLDASSHTACENYLKGKTFTGGSARLEFEYDGTVSAYDQGGTLVFGGTLEIGTAESEVSRWIHVRDMSGEGKLQFLLSNDGKLMEPSSFVIYKPE